MNDTYLDVLKQCQNAYQTCSKNVHDAYYGQTSGHMVAKRIEASFACTAIYTACFKDILERAQINSLKK